MRKEVSKVCYICGEPAENRDHIPPQGIFPDPKPTDLITVPSCHRCNDNMKLDDEYFRWFIATGSAKNPSATRLIKERVIKRFMKKPALLHSIMKKATKVDIYSTAGIYLGQQPAFHYDRKRVQIVIDKIIRGLYLHEKGHRLSNNYHVRKFILNPEIPQIERPSVIALPLKDIGNGLFSYRYQQCSEDEGITLWFLMFFDQMLFMTMTELGKP